MKKEHRLIELNGMQRGSVFSISDEIFKIGRFSGNHLKIEGKDISRFHASIKCDNEQAVLKDLSSNGTFINHKPLAGKDVQLKHGDLIAIGTYTFKYVCTDKAISALPGKNTNVKLLFDAARMDTFSKDYLFPKKVTPIKKKQVIKELSAEEKLLAFSQAIAASSEQNNLINLVRMLSDELYHLLNPDNSAIFLLDDDSGELVSYSARSHAEEVNISSSAVLKTFEAGQAFLLNSEGNEEHFQKTDSIKLFHINSVICVPLIHCSEKLGVLYVHREKGTPFAKSDLECAQVAAGIAASAISSVKNAEKLNNTLTEAVEILMCISKIHDDTTANHAANVSNIAVAIAREAGWSEDDLNNIRLGGLLHDLGKVSVDRNIIAKPGKLNQQEKQKVIGHAESGASILQNSNHLKLLVPYCLYHHERYDGTGYPAGLKGEDIPFGVRIITVADAFEALTGISSYKEKPLSVNEALSEIETHSGTQFDPHCVQLLSVCIDKGTVVAGASHLSP